MYLFYSIYNLLSIKDSYKEEDIKDGKIDINLFKRVNLKSDFKYGLYILENISIVEDSLTKDKKIVYKNHFFNLKKRVFDSFQIESSLRYQIF